jgi:hypothetical protein
MESMTYIGQTNNPFIMSLDLKNLKKNNLDNDKEKDSSSSLVSKYQKEISFLKNYIQKINTHIIRKKLNMEIIPSLEEGFALFSEKIKNGEDHSKLFEDTINEWMNRLFNVNYINPLITLYENYIQNLEEELKKSKEMNKKYENNIVKLVNENNNLRNNLIIKEEELKNFLEVRNESGDSSSLIIMDRDYIMKVEERNQLLSKENEILLINYNKLQNEFMQSKSGIGFNSNEFNDMKYQKLNQNFLKMENDYKILLGQKDINQKKLIEISEKNNDLEIENINLKKEIEIYKSKLKVYEERNKNFSQLLNDNIKK